MLIACRPGSARGHHAERGAASECEDDDASSSDGSVREARHEAARCCVMAKGGESLAGRGAGRQRRSGRRDSGESTQGSFRRTISDASATSTATFASSVESARKKFDWNETDLMVTINKYLLQYVCRAFGLDSLPGTTVPDSGHAGSTARPDYGRLAKVGNTLGFTVDLDCGEPVQVGESHLALNQLLTIPEHKTVVWFSALRVLSTEDCFAESQSIVRSLVSKDYEPPAKESKGATPTACGGFRATQGRSWREMLPVRCARMLWRRRPATSRVKPVDEAAFPAAAAMPVLCCTY